MNTSDSKMKKTFKKYTEFLNEALVILDLKGTMKNEFMNSIELKLDFENARRLFYDNGSCILTHENSNVFELRTYNISKKEDLDGIIERVNNTMKRFQFSRTGAYKKSDILNEYVWKLSCKLL
jgi:hypothetical protein